MMDPKSFSVETRKDFLPIFDGSSLKGWEKSGGGNFDVQERALTALPGKEPGLLRHVRPAPSDFILSLEWRTSSETDNSGIFVRFSNPTEGKDLVQAAIRSGFEIQIDSRGAPHGLDIHKTGAIYGQPNQFLSLSPALPPGRWNHFEIHVEEQNYSVFLNGSQVTRFHNPDPERGVPTSRSHASFIGLQAHTGLVSFRRIGIKPVKIMPEPVFSRLTLAG